MPFSNSKTIGNYAENELLKYSGLQVKRIFCISSGSLNISVILHPKIGRNLVSKHIQVQTRKSWRSYRSGFHCYYCYTVSKNLFLLLCCFYKVFTALKKPILFLRCFYYIAAPAKFLLLLLFQQCWRNSKSDVENLWLWLYIRYIRCKSDVVIHLIGMIICIIQMWKLIWFEYYKCKSEVEIHFIRILKRVN